MHFTKLPHTMIDGNYTEVVETEAVREYKQHLHIGQLVTHVERAHSELTCLM